MKKYEKKQEKKFEKKAPAGKGKVYSERKGQLEAHKENEDFAYGFYAVEEALKAGRGNKLFAQDSLKGKKLEGVKEIAQQKSVPIQWVPKEKLDLLSDGGVHQGVVLGVTQYQYWELEQLLATIQSKEEAPFLVILDGIEDPHNLGSILRTADASGVSGVIIPKHRAVGVTSIVAKTSTGAVEYVPICRVTNLVQTVKKLKEAGFWIFGTDVTGVDYSKWNTQGSVALVIGNEGQGMSPLLKKEMDETIQIPMTGHVQSLNASVAAGILMYEVYRNRK